MALQALLQSHPSPDAREDVVGNCLPVALPVIAVLLRAANFITPAPVAVHQPEVDAVGNRQPNERRLRVIAGNGPPNAHGQVSDVVEVAGEAPVARGKQQRALLGLDELRLLVTEEDASAPRRPVLVRRTTVVHVVAEEVLLNVRHPEEDHAKEVHQDANDGESVILVDVAVCLALLLGQEAHEGDRVEAAKEAPVTIGEHEPEQVVADVRSGQVGRLHQVVVEDVIPVGCCNEDCRQANVVEITFVVAEGVSGRALEKLLNIRRHGLVVPKEKAGFASIHGRQPATVVHAGQVGDVQDHPSRQAWACIPEALQVEGSLEDAMEESRVAHHAHEEVVEEVLGVENTMVLLELRVVHVTTPEDPVVDVEPQGHDVAGNHSFRQQGPHVGKDVIRLEVSIPAEKEESYMAQKKAEQAIHRVDELATIL
mmetsp:Transcript_40392/g.72294  ORF Transcript_40392/g.72294 Transcript_40392/m.72294 type:complete len:426 (-) Transcript_40392:445-1722(-)